MPSTAGPDTNRFHCESCGRYFNTADEFAEHQQECAAIKRTGSGSTDIPPERDPEKEREYFSTP
jgi:hypothetical protein